MAARSRLVRIKIKNLGCVGPDGLDIDLDNIVCLVGRNNSGKSTILRGYELAATAKSQLLENDRCSWAKGPTEVELWLHIPQDTQNIADRWVEITKDGQRLLRSRWQWDGINSAARRTTWDPKDGEYAEDGKAGGADAVFNSRLPKPIRIGSLQNADGEHSQLLKLITEPIAKKLQEMQKDEESQLANAIKVVMDQAQKAISEYEKPIEDASKDLQALYQNVFPGTSLKIKVGLDNAKIDTVKNLEAGSSVKITEGNHESPLKQQGTGSQRALFWALLQVRQKMQRETKLREEQKKKADKATKKKSKAAEENIDSENNANNEEIALAGYMLLIDEPENALHPMAIRAACRYLYDLSGSDDWQIIMATHSPYFINPFEDHTTIVRLDRTATRTTPKIYRADSIRFEPTEIANLKALLRMDIGLAEMFFGSYPVVVEGDTEYAAYMASVMQKNDESANGVAIIRAQGKETIPLVIKVIMHFKVNFGVLHDSDSPKCSNTKKNTAWKTNKKIIDLVREAREASLVVYHRVSVPDFERSLNLPSRRNDKPWRMYSAIAADEKKQNEVKNVFQSLVSGGANIPLRPELMEAASGDFMVALQHAVTEWALQNGREEDPKYQFDI
jgi:putative ATP-dependent endonuclease of the OLD family